ncbi:hypothetical protein B296_00054452 [Ensete ventricosum]|uniref:RING-type E3 ubiquitin transferase n=1 Tax=Ensete ventricosum TaxID=4639 RepID=A0A426Y3T2_ENSVE|nr:hypothetical protein B296_00054452 [Ensete ventricosum]
MADSDPFARSGGSGTAGHASRPTAPLHHHRHPHGVNWNLPLLLGRATVRRLLDSPPPAAAAAVQLEERHHGWGYSRPVVALDVVWNSAFVLVSVAVLLSTWKERPATPIRAWVFGYVVQCLLHVAFVCFEYRRRRRLRERRRSRWIEVEEDEDEESRFVRISMLTVVFLAFDVFFAMFCIMLACVIGIALCCCLPCIIAFLHAVAAQEGASDTDLSTLPKFRFCQGNQPDKLELEHQHQIAITINEQDSLMDLALPPEDSVT